MLFSDKQIGSDNKNLIGQGGFASVYKIQVGN